jgi:ammonium transporter Rh
MSSNNAPAIELLPNRGSTSSPPTLNEQHTHTHTQQTHGNTIHFHAIEDSDEDEDVGLSVVSADHSMVAPHGATSTTLNSPVRNSTLNAHTPQSLYASGGTSRTISAPETRTEGKPHLQYMPSTNVKAIATEAEIDEGRTALLLSAASKNNPERVLQLIQSGISPSVCDYDRRTALHIASSDNFYEVVKVLVETGANVNATDRFGHSPLDEAVSNGHHDIADLLRYYNATHGSLDKLEQKLIAAAAENRINDASLLLQSGVSPNCSDYDFRTPLHLAVAEGNVEMARLLLKYGANADVEDRWGLSARADASRRATRTGNDPMRDLLVPIKAADHQSMFSSFFFLYGAFEIALIILMGLFGRYDELADGEIPPEDGQAEYNARYTVFTNVHIMIFIGFAYLMVFLRKHGYSSVGLTFLIGALIIQWYPLVKGFWDGALAGHFEKIHFDIKMLITSDFCAGSILITFGVVLGKVSPPQMLMIAIFETIFYTLNERLTYYLGVADIGGSMVIHMFGAYFGIALSICLGKKGSTGHPNNSAVYHSDMLAMIGTIFLWMYWPSFNGALGTGSTQMRAAINTTLSISASCVTAFLTSHLLRGERKFHMVDIQNATLAGGVAVGTCADLLILPGPSMAIGAMAGALSVFGYVKVQPFLETYIGLHDTCGVHNLHGMPSLLGAFAGVIAATQRSHYGPEQLETIYPLGHSDRYQALMQLAYIGITLGIAILSGIFTSLLCTAPILSPPKHEDELFEDSPYWEVPELEIPYYFDKRGEISRGAENMPLLSANSKYNHGLSHRPRHDNELEAKVRALEEQVAAMRKLQRSTALLEELTGSTTPNGYTLGYNQGTSTYARADSEMFKSPSSHHPNMNNTMNMNTTNTLTRRHNPIQINAPGTPPYSPLLSPPHTLNYGSSASPHGFNTLPNGPAPTRLELLLDKVLKKLNEQ